jgi:acyl carrier protein
MDPRFTAIVRSHLKYLSADQELAPGAALKGLGLDSMAAVTLMLDIEDEFGVTIPDSALTADTFRTPQNLWAAVTAAMTSIPR